MCESQINDELQTKLKIYYLFGQWSEQFLSKRVGGLVFGDLWGSELVHVNTILVCMKTMKLAGLVK